MLSQHLEMKTSFRDAPKMNRVGGRSRPCTQAPSVMTNMSAPHTSRQERFEGALELGDMENHLRLLAAFRDCLLYTYDAADE